MNFFKYLNHEIETVFGITEIIDSKFSNNINKKNNISKEIIKPSNEELQLHKKYLKSHLPKNYYN